MHTGVEELKREFDDRIHFVLLYTREAHPGQGRWKDISQPTTYEKRVQLAERTRQDLSVTTLMLIDEMDNQVKRQYGGRPNSAYLIGQDGKVFYKQPWMDPNALRAPLEALLAAGGSGGEQPPRFPIGRRAPRRARPSRRGRSSPVVYVDLERAQFRNMSTKAWNRDYSSAEAFLKSVEPNRARWRKVIRPPALATTGQAEACGLVKVGLRRTDRHPSRR
jgi:hypothetical protein